MLLASPPSPCRRLSCPLLFQLFKPDRHLKPDDTYQTKASIASQLVRTLVHAGFAMELVLADGLYRESGPLREPLGEPGVSSGVAICQNHGMGCSRGQPVRSTRWRHGERAFSHGSSETRYIREVVYGRRRDIHFYHLKRDPDNFPAATTRFVMTNLPDELRQELGSRYGLRA